jgi:hypothetical protein
MVDDPEMFGELMGYIEAETKVKRRLQEGRSRTPGKGKQPPSGMKKSPLTQEKDRRMADMDRTMSGAHSDLAKKFPHLMENKPKRRRR